MTVFEDSAIAYARDEGLAVFPLKPRGKTPLVTHGLDDATTDLLTIETWWSRWPEANVAIRTGTVVVIDEDEDGAFAALCKAQHQPVPTTRVARTGTGHHYYFTAPNGGAIRNTAGKLGVGIDTRGIGGYVVAPPSVHPSGSPYVWENEREPAELPAWVVTLLEKRESERQPMSTLLVGNGTTPYGQRALEAETHAVAVAAEGTRNDTLNTAAFNLGQLVAGGELDEWDARNGLDAAARACGLPGKEAAATIASGFTSGLGEARRAPEQSPPITPLRVVPDVTEARPWLERASDLLTGPDPGPTPFLVESLLVDRCVAAFQGPPKIGKTWVLLELALAITTGRAAFGRFAIPEAGPVILILEESGRAALHRRLDALVRGNAIAPDSLVDLHFAANLRVRLDDDSWQARLADAAAEVEPRAIFLDPLARLKKPTTDENAQKELAPVLEYLRDLRDKVKATCMFVHHTGHGGDHLRGTSDLESWWESKLTLRKRETAAGLSSEHREAEAMPEFQFLQAWDPLTRSLRLQPTTDPLAEKVAQHLRWNPDASANEVYDAVGGNRTRVLQMVKEHKAQSGSDELEPPRNHPSESPLAGGSTAPLFRGAGTTAEPGGSESSEPAQRNPDDDIPF